MRRGVPAHGVGPIVKISDELMDVKVLHAVSPEGLEQWVPVMKEGFPLSAADVSTVLAMLEIDPSPLDRDAYTLEQFLSEVVAPHPEVSAVPIHKRAGALHVGWLHGRGDRSAGRRRPDADHRHRVRRSRQGDRGRQCRRDAVSSTTTSSGP